MNNASFPLDVENLRFFMTDWEVTFVLSFYGISINGFRLKFLEQNYEQTTTNNSILQPEDFCQYQLAHLDKNSN